MKKTILTTFVLLFSAAHLKANNILILNASSQLGQGIAKHLQNQKAPSS